MPRDRRRSHDSGEEDQYIILVKDIPRHCRWQELKDMTRSYGGEHSLKAEVFELGDGSQMGHCTVKGKTAATQVYEKFCNHGWNGQCVCVSLAILEKPGVLKTIQGPRRSRGGAHIQTNRTPTHVAISGAPRVVNSMLPSHSQYANTSNPTEQIMRGTPYTTMTADTANVTMPSINTSRVPHSGHLAQVPSAYHASAPYTITHAPPVRAMPIHQATGTPLSSRAGQTGTSTRNPTKLKSGSGTVDSLSRPVNDGSTVLLSGLPSCQSETHLRSILRRFGVVVYLEIHPDSRNPGKCKGTARARYKTMSEALAAARNLDGQTLAGRRIAVKQVNNDDAAALSAMTRHSQNGSKRTTTTVADARKPSVSSASAPPLLKQKSSNAKPLHESVSGSNASSKALSSSAPPKLSSTGRPNDGRGSTSTSTSTSNGSGTSKGSNSTSPVGPLVVNGATYSRRPSRKDDSSASDDSSEDETAESDEDEAADSSNDGDERECGYRGSGEFFPSLLFPSSSTLYCVTVSWSDIVLLSVVGHFHSPLFFTRIQTVHAQNPALRISC
ncbi:hypothetical protein ABEF94_003775 [Exophiala dermatitidis]